MESFRYSFVFFGSLELGGWGSEGELVKVNEVRLTFYYTVNLWFLGMGHITPMSSVTF